MDKPNDPKQNEQHPWTATSLGEAAGIYHTYIARLCRQGKLNAYKFGQSWLIPYEEGITWLNERETREAPKED